MDAALLEWCTHQVTVEPYAGTDSFGAPTYGPPVPYPARVVGEIKMVRATDGEEKVSSTRVAIPGPPDGPAAIDPRSRITLPDGTTPPILAVQALPDEAGQTDHTVLRLT